MSRFRGPSLGYVPPIPAFRGGMGGRERTNYTLVSPGIPRRCWDAGASAKQPDQPIWTFPEPPILFLLVGSEEMPNRQGIEPPNCGRSSAGRAPPCQGGCREFESRRPLSYFLQSQTPVFRFRAIGAAVARFPDTEEVTGSIPVSPTPSSSPELLFSCLHGRRCSCIRSGRTPKAPVFLGTPPRQG